MNRRTFLATAGTAGAAGLAGCGARSEQALTDPTVQSDSSTRRALVFSDDDGEVASLGVSGAVADGVIPLRTELSHRDGTEVESLTLRVWMPDNESDTPATVALASPVEGDSSPPPVVHLRTPDRDLGTVIEITDLDDLADETISTVELLVRPRSGSGATVAIEGDIELADGGFLGTDYSLSGRLDLTFPALDGE